MWGGGGVMCAVLVEWKRMVDIVYRSSNSVTDLVWL